MDYHQWFTTQKVINVKSKIVNDQRERRELDNKQGLKRRKNIRKNYI